jgi:5-methylcytosine-specific restriction endonuclease McrA
MPCHPARARQLLHKGRAVVHRLVPFTIRLKDRTVEESTVQPVRLKISPGSKTTGFAILREDGDRAAAVLHVAELAHKRNVRMRMERRRSYRRNRRGRKTRYRPARFDNRRRPQGWLAPSLRANLEQTVSWANRYRRWAPVAAVTFTLHRFDTQKMLDPEIRGIEYQQGTLQGYEIREYLLAKFGHLCAYCHGKSGDPHLEVEHIVPRSRGGSDRVSNLALACHTCNQGKGDRTAVEFGHPEVQALAAKPMRDAAAVNSTRWAIFGALKATALPVEAGTGGRTRFNRARLGLGKSHPHDAVAARASTPTEIEGKGMATLQIVALGRGSYRRSHGDRSQVRLMHTKTVRGFRSGDLVRAVVPAGKRAGVWTGPVTVRASGSFRIGETDGIGWRRCRLLQRADGYGYAKGGSGAFVPGTSAGATGVA